MLGPLAASRAGAGVVALRLRAARRAERAYADASAARARTASSPGAEGFTLEGTNGRALLHASRIRRHATDTALPRRPAARRRVHGPRAAPAGARTRPARLRRGERGGLRLRRARRARAASRASVLGRRDRPLDGRRARGDGSPPKPTTCASLALLAPYLDAAAVPWRSWRAPRPLWSLAVPYLGGRGGESSVHDPVARAESFAYGMFPPRARARALCDGGGGPPRATGDQRADARRELARRQPDPVRAGRDGDGESRRRPPSVSG